MSRWQDMSEHPDRNVEERLRTALRDRARDFTASPGAWEQTQARRGDTMTRVTSHRGGRRRQITPLAAAAAVVAIAAGLLIQRGSPLTGPAPAGGGASPAALPPLSPSHGPLPPGTQVPDACAHTAPPPPVYRVTEVSAGRMPAQASDWFKAAPPATPIVRVDVTYRGDRAVAYLWFTRPGGRTLALADRIAFLLPPNGETWDTVHWDGADAGITAIPAGHTAQLVHGDGNRLVDYEFGLASTQVASVMVTPLRGLPSIDALSGPTIPVPGRIISGHGFPGNVYVSAYPSTPTYGDLIARNAAGKTVGRDSLNSAAWGEWCEPLAIMNDFQAPRGGDAFSTGLALPQVASVTAVLPDGSQLRGGFSGRDSLEPYYWGWQVRYPRQDASLTVTLVFRDAAGRVLGQVKTIPGKSPYDLPSK